ncbi:hypothetical protein BJV82DRAFT_612440 [Fennellomyces sp. T-0311]|nr:hypothetical protein BJV82DRAFT_612440 [Fennellomyces sp. T-0311]
MTRTTLNPFPAHNLDAHPVNLVFHKTAAAIDEQDYVQAVEFASRTLAKIQELLVMQVLDHRAYAYGMQGKFVEAIKDARDMITLEPTLAKGYFRLGDLYQMQGKQQSAIDAYDLGLQSASPDHSDYARIVHSKESAIKKNDTRVDFVGRLPIEMADEIISLLPTESKFVCLTVSSVWRNKILQCLNTWKTLVSGDGARANRTISVMSQIACHVEDLTINTTDRNIFLRYLVELSTDNFGRIKSLKLDHNATKHFNTKTIMPVANALWHIHKNLTKIVIHLTRNRVVISLVDILSVCSNLSSIEYSAPSQLSHVIGELLLLKSENNLVDMHLKAKTITGQDLQKLLPHCQRLRRLILHGCDTSVLDVVDIILPHLDTLGYNPDMNEIRRLDRLDVNTSAQGLRRLYTNNGGPAVPAASILPLIERNADSLQVLYSNLSAPVRSDLAMTYSDLRLPHLNKLVFWGDTSGTMQPLILRAISTCTTLTHLEAVNCKEISALAQRLKSLPQLEFFNITHSSVAAGETELSTCLICMQEIHCLRDDSELFGFELARTLLPKAFLLECPA